MSDTNVQVRALAGRYFESSENAERFIQNYQEIKLNMEIPYNKRKSLHESVINTINIAKEKHKMYESILPQANKQLQEFLASLEVYKKALQNFEDARCE